MPKLIIVGRRRPGATRAQALHHLMHVHGRLVIDPPADAGAMPDDYVQNHVFDGAYPRGADAAHGLERDLVTELWFASPQALGASTSTPYYKTRLQPDEDNFVDKSTVAAGLYEASPRSDPHAGPFKLFVFLAAAPGVAPDAFLLAFDAAAQDARSRFGAQDVVRNVPLRRPGATPFADGVIELWFASAAAARTAADAVAQLHAAFAPGLLDPAACLHLLAEEFATPRLREAHRAHSAGG